MPVKQKRRAKSKVEAPVKSRAKPTHFDFELVSDAIVHQAVAILGPLDGQRILICAGKGYTAAAGLAAVPKLLRDGARPSVLLAIDGDDLVEDARLFLKQAEVVRAPITLWSPNLPGDYFQQYDLLIDALLGADTKGNPRYPLDQMITGINDSRTPVLAIDTPSGLDPKTGKPGKPTVVALETLQVTIPTEKLLDKAGALFVGKVVGAR